MARDFYRRHLPHFDAVGRRVFVTFNLKGALPAEALARLRTERLEVDAALENAGLSLDETTKSNLLLEHARNLFRIGESFLDRAESGPKHLADPDAAAVVRDCIVEGSGRWYSLFAFVVMPNHVHLLIEPLVDLDRITGGIKKKTAAKINRLQGQAGRMFWQDESFDHFPRDEASFARIAEYIERNPVKAGLCARDADWPWSSAAKRKS